MSKDKQLQIRNSTAEVLVFTSQSGENGIEVRVAEETAWLNQKLIAELFDVDVRTVNGHLQNIYSSGELTEDATIRNFRIVHKEGSREVARNLAFYNSTPSYRSVTALIPSGQPSSASGLPASF